MRGVRQTVLKETALQLEGWEIDVDKRMQTVKYFKMDFRAA